MTAERANVLSFCAVSEPTGSWEVESKAYSFSLLGGVGDDPTVAAFLKKGRSSTSDAFDSSGACGGVVKVGSAYVAEGRKCLLLFFPRRVPPKALAVAGSLS